MWGQRTSLSPTHAHNGGAATQQRRSAALSYTAESSRNSSSSVRAAWSGFCTGGDFMK